MRIASLVCVRLLDRYVRICAVPRYVRASYSHVFETIVRALELSISERLDSVPSTSTTVIHTPVRGREEISFRDVFPVSANPTRGGIRKRGGCAGRERGRWNLFNADISSAPATVIAWPEPGLRLHERRKWDFCVDAAGSFFCSRGLFTQNDRLPMRPPSHVYSPRIHLGSLSGRKNRERKGGWYIPFARPSVVDTAGGDRNMGSAIRSPDKSCPCDTRVSSHVNGRVRSNERSNERSVSNGWTTLDRLRNRWERGLTPEFSATALDIAEYHLVGRSPTVFRDVRTRALSNRRYFL